MEIKCQLDATDEFLLQILLLVQHVSGTIMPIIRSSSVLYKWLLPVVFGAWFSSCRYGVELRVVCPVCGPANRTWSFYFHILSTMHGQNHIKFQSIICVYTVSVLRIKLSNYRKGISDTNHSHTNSLMYYFVSLYVSLNIFQIFAFTFRQYLQ